MSGDHDLFLWDIDDANDSKVDVSFSITSHGVTSSLSFSKPDDVEWQEILDPIVKHVEAHWGYPFDLSRESSEGTTVGIWHPGQDYDE